MLQQQLHSKNTFSSNTICFSLYASLFCSLSSDLVQFSSVHLSPAHKRHFSITIVKISICFLTLIKKDEWIILTNILMQIYNKCEQYSSKQQGADVLSAKQNVICIVKRLNWQSCKNARKSVCICVWVSVCMSSASAAALLKWRHVHVQLFMHRF